MTDLNYIPSLTYVAPAHSRVVGFTESPPVANLPPYAGVVPPAVPVKRTRGQEIAEAMLRGGGTNVILIHNQGFVGFSVAEGTDDWVRNGIVQVVSTAIDAALAEQREKFMAILEDGRKLICPPRECECGCGRAAFNCIAAAIRNAD